MPQLTNLDAQDAILADEAWHEFLDQWNTPEFIKQIKPLWMRMPEAQKEQLSKANPELYDQVNAMFATS